MFRCTGCPYLMLLTNSFFLCIHRHRSSCAGAYNAFQGQSKRRKQVTLYSRFCGTTSRNFQVGSYAGAPAIVSTKCTGEASVNGLDGGKVCINCLALRKANGSSNSSVPLGKWGKTLTQCLERRDRSVLTASDLDDAAKFTLVPDNHLGPAGIALKEEAARQVEYGKFMSQLDTHLVYKSYSKVGNDSVPGPKTLFNEAADLCEKNPKFQSSLIVALLKAAMAKEKTGSNAKTDEKVVNFYRFIKTYDPKAAAVLSANLGGPSMRWMQELNARDREECILACGKDGEKVTERMVAAIKRRSIGGVPGPFSLAIDATKLSPVIEASSGHIAIIGAVHPDELIDIKDKTKDEVRKILDGESEEYGNLEAATEVKVSTM